MPTPAPGQISPSTTRRVAVIAASLPVVLGLTFIAFSWGNIMSSLESANFAASGEAGQQAYDPSLLKILSAPSRPAPAPITPGVRKVVVPDLSLRTATPSAAEGQAGNYEITLDISQQVLEPGCSE